MTYEQWVSAWKKCLFKQQRLKAFCTFVLSDYSNCRLHQNLWLLGKNQCRERRLTRHCHCRGILKLWWAYIRLDFLMLAKLYTCRFHPPLLCCFPAPEQWTTVPVVVKIYKLLINELSNQLESSMSAQQGEDDDEVSNQSEISWLLYFLSTNICI